MIIVKRSAPAVAATFFLFEPLFLYTTHIHNADDGGVAFYILRATLEEKWISLG
jgi:hypothetical protein